MKLKDLIIETIDSSIWKKALRATELEAEDMVYKDWDEFTGAVCNKGFCDIFAGNLKSQLDGAELWSTEDSCDGNGTNGHVWIKYKGKYYDAEVPNGVTDYKQLPFFQRCVGNGIKSFDITKL